MPTTLAITGAAGRMGRCLIRLAAVDPALRLAAALENADNTSLSQDAGTLAGGKPLGLNIATEWTTPADVLIEFSSPPGTLHWLDQCIERNTPIVIGTTGHSEDQLARIRAAASKIPVLKSPNMSVGVNVLLRAAKLLAKTLDESYDVEIVETHHRFKADAPSGTAIALRDAVIDARREAGRGESNVIYGRHGQSGQRPAGEIAVHALRLGDTIGEHTLAFGNLGETITLAHSAHSRDTFAAGALHAAKWIAGKPPGFYTVQDVLFGSNV